MIAIETRFTGPTNTKPGRVIATTSNGQRLVLSWERAIRGADESGFDGNSSEACHRYVATELAREYGWLDERLALWGGSTKRGYAFVFVPVAARPELRIRHCEGNKSAWLLARVQPDGTDSDSFGSYTTGMSIDGLLRSPAATHLLIGDPKIELIP